MLLLLLVFELTLTERDAFLLLSLFPDEDFSFVCDLLPSFGLILILTLLTLTLEDLTFARNLLFFSAEPLELDLDDLDALLVLLLLGLVFEKMELFLDLP